MPWYATCADQKRAMPRTRLPPVHAFNGASHPRGRTGTYGRTAVQIAEAHLRSAYTQLPYTTHEWTVLGEYTSGEYRGAVARALLSLLLESKAAMSTPPARPSSALQRHGFRRSLRLASTLPTACSPAPAPAPAAPHAPCVLRCRTPAPAQCTTGWPLLRGRCLTGLGRRRRAGRGSRRLPGRGDHLRRPSRQQWPHRRPPVGHVATSTLCGGQGVFWCGGLPQRGTVGAGRVLGAA